MSSCAEWCAKAHQQLRQVGSGYLEAKRRKQKLVTYLIYKLWNGLILQASVKGNEQYVYLQKWSSSGSTFDSSHWPHPRGRVHSFQTGLPVPFA